MTEPSLQDELRDLLFEPFRCALLNRLWDPRIDDPPSEMIRSVAEVYLLEAKIIRRKIDEIIRRHGLQSGSLRDPPKSPGQIKNMVLRVGQEAWKKRFSGPVEVELTVTSNTVSLHDIRHPDHA